MKLFEDLPSTNVPITAENLNQIQDKLVVVSSTEPTGDNREKVWIQKGKNLLDKNNVYNLFMADSSTVENLDTDKCSLTTGWIKCKPNTTYVISGTFNRYRWQTKSEDGTITWAGWYQVLTTNDTATYMRCYFYNTEDSTEITPSNCPDFQIEQGSVATEYEEYIEPRIYIKNDNDVYEEFDNINKLEKSMIDAYRNDYTTTSTGWEKVDFAGITNRKGNAFSIQDGSIVCNKTMIVSIEGAYYWTGISAKRVGYKINKNDAMLNNAVYNKFCPTGGYYDVVLDRMTAQVSKGDKISLYVRTEEGAGGTSGSRGKFIVQEL